MKFSIHSSLLATMLLLAAFAAAAPVGVKGDINVRRALYPIPYQDLKPQIMKRQPDNGLEQLADDTLAAAGSDKSVESSGFKQLWGVSKSFFLLLGPH